MSNYLQKTFHEQFKQQHQLLQLLHDGLHGLELPVPPVAEITAAWAKQATSDRPEATQRRAKDYSRRVQQIIEAWPGVVWLLIDPDEGEVAAEASSLEEAITAKIAERRGETTDN